MVQGGDAQRSAAPTAYPRAHWTDNKTRSSCPRPSHWLRKIAHRPRLCLRAKTIPHQWHIEARSPSPTLGNVAFRHNARPLRQQDASHEGHRICSHPTLLPPPPCCLKSVHELPTTHNVNATSYTLTSPCAHWSRKGACNHISTWLPVFVHTPAAPHHHHVQHSSLIPGRAAVSGEISGGLIWV